MKLIRLSRFKNYMLTIERSIDSDLFKNLYAFVDEDEQDILQDGKLSCAYFVSSVLFHYKLIEDLHTTVRGLEADLERSGWQKVDDPRLGSIILWEPMPFADGSLRRHIGFYVGGTTAVSNSTLHRVPKTHDMNSTTEGAPRGIEAIYWHSELKKH